MKNNSNKDYEVIYAHQCTPEHLRSQAVGHLLLGTFVMVMAYVLAQALAGPI